MSRATHTRQFTILVPEPVDIWKVFEPVAEAGYRLLEATGGAIHTGVRYRSISAGAHDHHLVARESLEDLLNEFVARGLEISHVSCHHVAVKPPTDEVWVLSIRGVPQAHRGKYIVVEFQATDAPTADRAIVALEKQVAGLATQTMTFGLQVVDETKNWTTTDDGDVAPRPPITAPAPPAATAVKTTEKETPRKKRNWPQIVTVAALIVAIIAIPAAIFAQDIREFFIGLATPSPIPSESHTP